MEEEPLLAGHEDGSHPDGISVHKLAAVLAALRVGALPSSAQASAALQAALRSPLLQVDGTVWTPEIGHGRVGVGKLTKEGEQVRNCTRDVIESVLGWLGTRNSDDQLQDFVHACRNSKIDLQLANAHLRSLPPYAKEQTKSSLWTVVIVIATSAELRRLLLDLLLLGRDTFQLGGDGPVAREINAIGDAVTSAAAEKIAEQSDVQAARHRAEAEKRRDNFIDRLTAVMNVVQANPSYRSAVHTLLTLARKCRASLDDTLALEPTEAVVPGPKSPFETLSAVLEPYTGGPGSLDSLLASIAKLRAYRQKENRFGLLLDAFDEFAEHALLEPEFIGSAAAHRQSSKLYEKLLELGRDNPEFRKDCYTLFGEVYRIVEAVANDRALGNVLRSLSEVALALESWLAQAARIAVGRDGVWGDLVEWVVPHIAGFLREVPLPRQVTRPVAGLVSCLTSTTRSVEYTSTNLDLALDAPSTLNTSFIPDEIRYDHAASFVLRPANAAASTTHDYTANSKLYVAGLRMKTGVGYWMRYNGFCFPVTEKGILDLTFGTGSKGGVQAEMSFSSLDSVEEQDKERRLFTVAASKATINQFDLSPHESSHPILQWFLRPILRRIAKAQIEAALQDQLTNGLDTLSRIAYEIRRRATSGVLGYVEATYTVLVQGLWKDEDREPSQDDDDSPEEQDGEAEETTDIHISAKGVSIDLEGGLLGVGSEGIVFPEGEAETPLPRPPVIQIIKDESKATVVAGREAGEEALAIIGEVAGAVQQLPELVKEEREHIDATSWYSEAFDF